MELDEESKAAMAQMEETATAMLSKASEVQMRKGDYQIQVHIIKARPHARKRVPQQGSFMCTSLLC